MNESKNINKDFEDNFISNIKKYDNLNRETITANNVTTINDQQLITQSEEDKKKELSDKSLIKIKNKNVN